MLVCQDLATKTELQELRDQINTLLGKPEQAGSSNIDVLQAGTLAGTAIFAGLTLDFEFVDDAVTKTKKVFGILPDGSRREWKQGAKALKFLQGIGQGAKAVANTTLNVSAGLALEIASLLVVIKNSTDILELQAWQEANTKTIDMQENEFTNMFKILNKYKNNLGQAQTDINNLQTKLTQQSQNNQTLQTNVANQQTTINDLKDNIDTLEKNDTILKKGLKALEQELTQYEADASQEIKQLKGGVKVLSLQYKASQDKINNLRDTVALHENRLTGMALENTLQNQRITELSFQQTFQHVEIGKLYNDLQQQRDLSTALSTSLAARVTILESLGTKQASSGGTNVNAVKAVADNQNKTLELVKNLTGSTVPIADITTTEILNNNSHFENTFNGLIPNISSLPGIKSDVDTLDLKAVDLQNQIDNLQLGNAGVTPQELDFWGQQFRTDLNTDLNHSWQTLLGVALVTNVVPSLDQIKNQTTPAAIGNALGSEICNQTASPTSCLNTGLRNPIMNENRNNLTNVANGLNTALNAAILAQGNSILGVVRDTNTAVRSSSFGLEAAKNAFDKAWNNTIVDKSLNTLNTVLSLHNALMLSRNLGQSIGDLATNFLAAINVKGHDDQAIDVSQFVSQKLAAFLSSVFGQANYEALVKGWNSANRILVSAQGAVSAIRGIKDALQQGQEIIVNRVATIGNSMKEQGVLEDNSFAWMDNNVNFRNAFPRLTNFIQNLQQIVEETNELVETGIEVQENVNTLYTNTTGALTGSEELQKAFDQFDLDKITDEADKEVTNASPSIANIDLIKNETP
jgi:hypothetical protein